MTAGACRTAVFIGVATLLAAPVAKSQENPISGQPLRYLIGGDGTPSCRPGTVVEVNYDAGRAPCALAIRYGNLFDEKDTGRLGPYLHSSDTAADYSEGQINPRGRGWQTNITTQLDRAKRLGYRFMEWDNPDAYGQNDVLGVVEQTRVAGIGAIAKNPLNDDIKSWAPVYIAHPGVVGIVVEIGSGSPAAYDAVLRNIGRRLPVWFVAFGRIGQAWVKTITEDAIRFGFGVSFSPPKFGKFGEYTDSTTIVAPRR